jgi:hypothetical protein
MKMSQEQYEKIINNRKISDSKPKRKHEEPLGGSVQRKEKSMGRVIVSFTGYRVRPLDPDNFSGSVKNLLDGLRHAGLILGDEPTKIKLVTDQVKVSHYEEEKTVIELEEEEIC